MKWFKVKSWHQIKHTSSFTSRASIEFTVVTAFCNRSIDFHSDEFEIFVKDTFSTKEKTCETCFRNNQKGQ